MTPPPRPWRPTDRTGGDRPMTAHAPAQTASVLIVEDDPDTASSLACFLRLGGGPRVATARDGPRGLAAALADPPDVVVLDLGLPRRNGLLVGEELLARLPNRPLLIAVTGYADPAARAVAAEAGFDHYLVKPADPFHIDALIQAHLRAGAPGDPPPA